MRSLRSLYGDAKLRTKFLLSFIVIVMITVCLISGVNYIVSVGVIKRNSGEFSQYLIGQIGINVDKLTTDIEQMAFQQFRNSSLSGTLSLKADSAEEEYARSRYINDFLNDVLFFEDSYLSVSILDAEGRTYEVKRKAVRQDGAELLRSLGLDDIKERRGRALWFRGEDDTLYMAKALYDIETSGYVGVIVIGVENGYIGDILAKVRNLMDGDVLILNESDQLFAPTALSGAAQRYMQSGLYRSDARSDFEYGGKHYISSVLATDYDKWRIVQIIDVGRLTRGTESLKFWTIGTLLVALLLASLMAARISKRITANISMLLQSMSRFTLDSKHERIVPSGRDEVGLLAAKFNSMAEKIDDLFHSVYREKMLAQQAEFRALQLDYKALQAQMNPHFLYNTLETIYSMAKLKGEEEIGELIYLLGRLLRDSLGKKGDDVSLREELEFVGGYLAIHQIVYGDRIAVEIETDEALDDCRVPKFILQPLVENAIVHGIEEKPGKARITIRCREEQGDLALEVEDNGVGMEREKAERLLRPDRAETREGGGKHTNVGILSVHRRIRILHGDSYGLSITSRKGEGTKVRVRLPAVRREATDDAPAGLGDALAGPDDAPAKPGTAPPG
ncbi:sensor histidine kinase [Cohnella fermenti]|uniref:histidine kinase n=1 Tax=Cohnella fermenti TaxID=2565925 RepID=A0A4S4C350_9BACL|nr:sensor histidine kinase [Cohnella fermenti]THF82157.1 sensor histidine kinase [Cohnella fermenti]